jgi:hypothetical protein
MKKATLWVSISLTQYLELLDWTGRQIRNDKTGSIPKHLAPILTRLGFDGLGWCELVIKFGQQFKRVAGNEDSLQQEASRREQAYMQAPALALFAESD